MNELTLKGFKQLSRFSVGAPLLIMIILAMMVVPLPALALDMLFTFNISLSLVVLLAVVYSARPLDLAVFPTVLLIATLLRLSLNIASTRVVLLNGHNGTDAAGNVIEAFGDFVVGGNYTVGFVVFAILVIINFVVVTKGAGRISEVSARFTLDAMPGKQMAIDADLNAGILTAEEAKQRRAEVAHEADFYGAMDGASKFVRGDAIAGILILIINILGGLAIGSLQHGMAFSEAARVFTLLTIGDGLAAQIPSLLPATAAAIMVTRVSTAQDMGQQIVNQLFANPKTLAVTGAVIGAIGLIPGMPNFAFLALASAAGAGAWFSHKARQRTQAEAEPEAPAAPVESREVSWEDVAQVDAVGLEVGYRLIPLVDKNQGGQLLSRLKGVRKKISQELGFLIPAVHVRDNLDLNPAAYRITLLGSTVAESEVHPGKELAINPGQVFGEIQGIAGKDPVFDLEATWIEADTREQAQSLGYTVVDASTVIATHMSHLLQIYVHELFGHDEAQQLLDRLAETHPKVVEDLVPKVLPLGTLVTVLKNLLRESVPIKDIRTILEVVAQVAVKSQEPGPLTAAARSGLARSIVQQINGLDEELPVVTLAPELEQILPQSVNAMATGEVVLEPDLANRISQSMRDTHERQQLTGEPTVLLVSDPLCELLARICRYAVKDAHVLAFSEVPDDKRIKIVATLGAADDTSSQQAA